jgi:hypothetical protein
VQEFIAHLQEEKYELRNKKGELVKTYTLSSKTIKNIVGVVKRIMGKKIWISLGAPGNGAAQERHTWGLADAMNRSLAAEDDGHLFAHR